MQCNQKLIPPCKDCTGRVLMCHDSCSKYKEFKYNTEAVQTARQEFLNKKSINVESVNRCKSR